jgi:SAM-dependent methyltransferase
VVVSDSRARPADGAMATPARVVWHDVECGGYAADLALWRELAGRAGAAVLDVGAGSGRVALDLARHGFEVTAVDSDPLLLTALDERARGLAVQTVCADARTFALARRDFDVCVVPMQTIQLLGGSAARVQFLSRAREHVRAGGAVACALLGALEPFDCADGQVGPAADRACVDGLLYLSRATRVGEQGGQVVIERERRIVPERASDAAASAVEPPAPERDVVRLDRVSAHELEREAREAGLHARARLDVAATDEHVGSVVVVLGV